MSNKELEMGMSCLVTTYGGFPLFAWYLKNKNIPVLLENFEPIASGIIGTLGDI